MPPSRWAKLKKLISDKAPFLLPAGWRARAALSGHPRTLIGAAREGERVKVVGQVRPVAPLITSPISGQACVFYSLLVKEVVDEGDGIRETTVASDERCCDFAVVDSSGEALVEPDGAEMNIPSFWEDRHHPAVERIARESPFLGAGPFWNKRFHYQEAMLCGGAWVAVIGTSRSEVHGQDAGGGPYRAPGVRLVFAGTREASLMVSSSLEDWIDYQ